MTTSATAVQNLVATAPVKAALTTAFVSFKQIPATDISGTSPNSVYYAYDPSTMTYWAFADFVPSSQASQQVDVGMQDGGSMGLFKMQNGGAWQVTTGSVPPICAARTFFPATVLAGWNYSSPATC